MENNITYENLSNELLKEINEFKLVFDYDLEDGNYCVFGEFGRFIVNNIDNKKLMLKCFDFILKLIRINSEKINQLIVIEIFEQIFINKNVYKKAKNYFKDEILIMFNKCEKSYEKILI